MTSRAAIWYWVSFQFQLDDTMEEIENETLSEGIYERLEGWLARHAN